MLSAFQRLGYAAPSFALAALLLPVYVLISRYYTESVGLSLATVGAVYIGVRLFDAISDPAMGVLSDRLRTRFGRRRPWLLLGCPVVVAAAWALFVPPAGAGVGWFAGALFALTLGWTVMLTPYYAWGAELSGDYRERARLAVWRDAVGLLGTIAVLSAYGIAANEADGLRGVATLIAISLPLGVALCLWVVPEPEDFSASGPPPTLASIAALMRDEPIFGRLLIAYFLNGAANALPATLFLYFVADRLAAPDWGGPLLMLYFGSAVLGAPLWLWLIRRFPKHRIWCVAMAYAGAVFLAALTLGPGDVAAFGVICVLTGAALGADLALPSAIQADLVDIDTARSGAQRTGVFFALWSLVTKAALALTGGAALILLGWSGFNEAAENGAFALGMLGFLYAGAPVVLKTAAIALMWRFPMGAAEQEALRARIEASRPSAASP